jgi:two-component SAPR family response regulator
MMLLQEITGVSIESFREQSRGKRIVLFYPWVNARTLFIHYYLNQSELGLLYYRLASQTIALHDWVQGCVDEFERTVGRFGANTRKLLHKARAHDLGVSLAHDLGEYAQGKPTVLYLDEVDQAQTDSDFFDFISGLVETLSENVQIAISSRFLTYQPWQEYIQQGHAVVLGTERRKNEVIFNLEQSPKPQLEIYGFGRGMALVNGLHITNWDGSLPRNLFFYFIDRPLVTRDDIFTTFWPNLNIKEATNVFHVTKRKITERISQKVSEGGEAEPDANVELTQYNGGFYLPSDKIVRHYDVANFQESIERAMIARTPQEQHMLLDRAIEIYRAPFMQGVEMEWVIKRRTALRELYAQALISMADLHRHDAPEQALNYYIRALGEMPLREDVHREVMGLYRKLGRYQDGIEQYNHLKDLLRRELDLAPSRETRELAQLIRSSI